MKMGIINFKGYSSMKECHADFMIYFEARAISHFRDRGLSIDSLLKKKILFGIRNATGKMKRMIEENELKFVDLELISHEMSKGHYSSMQSFLSRVDEYEADHDVFHKVIRSNAFKKGKLNSFAGKLPSRLESKNDLISFIKANFGISNDLLRTVCEHYTKKDWESWLIEAHTEKQLSMEEGDWY